jgi:hypothetical protein
MGWASAAPTGAAHPVDDAPLTGAERPAGHMDPPSARGDCDIVCRFGDIIENEPACADGYVDAVNGGCNFTPNVFGTIECSQTICGRYGTYIAPSGGNFRDTDWYHFTIPVAADVTWTATGEAPTRVFILQGTCPASSLGTARANACEPASVTLTNLAPGTYSVFVGTDVFQVFPAIHATAPR